MPVCPNCKKEAKRRISGKCPNCGVAVECYRPRGKNKETLWVYESRNLTELVEVLESLIGTAYNLDFKFQDRLPELSMARTLYDKCGYSQTLAIEVIYCFFDPDIPRTQVWCKNPKSMATVIWDGVNESGAKGCFSMALAIAKSRVQSKQKEMTGRQAKFYI